MLINKKYVILKNRKNHPYFLVIFIQKGAYHKFHHNEDKIKILNILMHIKNKSLLSEPMSSADSSSPRVVTLELIRKRSEHNEGMVSNLEEIALHQEELEALGPILGRTCGKTLRILLLQNNVISKIAPSDFRHFKAIEYLNLALNNVEVVEGIQHLEFLNKLDLTLNFIDVDRLEESVEHMKNLRSLKELFLMGNTCCVQIDKDSNRSDDEIDFDPDIPYRRKSGWRGCRMYVVASLTQLSSFDGIFITRSERIKATQKLPLLTAQLRNLAKLCRAYKEDQKLSDYTNNKNDKCEKDEESLTSHTPQSRSEMSKELSIQKAEKLEMERANQPKTRGEKEFEMEQEAAIKKARERELKGSIKQCNGKFSEGLIFINILCFVSSISFFHQRASGIIDSMKRRSRVFYF